MRFSSILFILSLLLSPARAQDAADALELWNTQMKKRFPDVKTVKTSELAEWTSDNPVPVLLDVRALEEYAVSHLPGALRASEDADGQLKALGIQKQDRVVVYCSVGYRSALLARKLTQAGWSNVYNLEGSIFAWANEDRPLVNEDAKSIHGAHPFNKKWGAYLRRDLWIWPK